jgi:carbon storage regulator CsrA
VLAIKRKDGQRVRVRVGDVDIWVQVVECQRGWVRLAFEAPEAAKIHREELLDDAEQFAAAGRAKRRAEFSVIAPFTPNG